MQSNFVGHIQLSKRRYSNPSLLFFIVVDNKKRAWSTGTTLFGKEYDLSPKKLPLLLTVSFYIDYLHIAYDAQKFVTI